MIYDLIYDNLFLNRKFCVRVCVCVVLGFLRIVLSVTDKYYRDRYLQITNMFQRYWIDDTCMQFFLALFISLIFRYLYMSFTFVSATTLYCFQRLVQAAHDMAFLK